MGKKLFYVPAIVLLGALAYFGFRSDRTTFFGSLFAAGLSVFIVFFIEIELRPQIRVVQENVPPVLLDGRKFLRVVVSNRALWLPLRLFMDRRPASQVRAWITFYTESNDLVFTRERRMIGRWSRTPEPVRPIVVTQSGDQSSAVTFLLDMSVTRDAVDIGSGCSELLDIVMRNPNDNGCYGWHNRIIQNPNPSPEDQFILPQGRYHALVTIETAGRIYRALFRIVCA